MHLPILCPIVLELMAVHTLLLFRIVMHPVVVDFPILTSGEIPLPDRERRVELIGWREKPVGQELIYGLQSDIATETLKSEPFTVFLDSNGISQSGPSVSLKQRFPFFKRQFHFPTLGHDLATILTSYGGDELFPMYRQGKNQYFPLTFTAVIVLIALVACSAVDMGFERRLGRSSSFRHDISYRGVGDDGEN